MIRKTNFFEGCSWFKSNNLGLALGIILKLYTGMAKWLKPKVRNFWCNSHVCRSYKGKTGRRPFCPPPPPILNMLNTWHSSLGFLTLSGLNKKCCKVRKTQANQPINKVIKVTSRASYYLIFTLFHKTFRKH